jgi:hypothetical protein
MLRLTVSRPVCLGIKHPSGAQEQTLFKCQTVADLLMWSTLSDKRTSLSFSTDTGPRQRDHSRVRVPRDSWPKFAVSDSRRSQPWGPGPHIYIPQKQGGLVILSATGFLFRRLLWLAGLRSTRALTLSKSNLESEFLLHNIYKSRPYVTGNTLRLGYKAQPLNVV